MRTEKQERKGARFGGGNFGDSIGENHGMETGQPVNPNPTFLGGAMITATPASQNNQNHSVINAARIPRSNQSALINIQTNSYTVINDMDDDVLGERKRRRANMKGHVHELLHERDEQSPSHAQPDNTVQQREDVDMGSYVGNTTD